MNRFFLIHRLRWPAVLLLAGSILLLEELGLIEHFWKLFIPLFLIVMGVLLLAERMSLTSGVLPDYTGQPYPGSPYPGAPAAAPAQTGLSESTSIVPAHSHDFGNSGGGQS